MMNDIFGANYWPNSFGMQSNFMFNPGMFGNGFNNNYMNNLSDSIMNLSNLTNSNSTFGPYSNTNPYANANPYANVNPYSTGTQMPNLFQTQDTTQNQGTTQNQDTTQNVNQYLNNNGTMPGNNNTQETAAKNDDGIPWGGIVSGAVIVTGLATLLDYTFAKGKHVKAIVNKFKSSKTPDAAKDPKLELAKFNNMDEAKTYFNKLGVVVDLEKCHNTEQAEIVANSLKKIKDAGIDAHVKSLKFSDITNNNKSIVVLFKDGQLLVKPNSTDFSKNGANLILKEISSYSRSITKESKIGSKDIDINLASEQLINDIVTKTGKTLDQVKASLLEKLNTEIGSKATTIEENLDDMFALMAEGKKEFSEGAMLLYDIAGGTRLPSKKFNNLDYKSYVDGLYEKGTEILYEFIK